MLVKNILHDEIKLLTNGIAPFFELPPSLGYVALLWALQIPHTILIVGLACLIQLKMSHHTFFFKFQNLK